MNLKGESSISGLGELEKSKGKGGEKNIGFTGVLTSFVEGRKGW